MQNELYHYGVLGMRWGVRKDKDTIFTRKSSRTTRGLERRLAKDEKRAAAGKYKKYDTHRLRKALRDSKRFDAAVQKRVNSMSKGKTFAQVLLMGSRGALRYNQLRTTGYGRVLSFLGGTVGKSYLDTSITNIGRGIATNSKYKNRRH